MGYFSAFPSYDSEEVTSYELGHKGSYMDNTLQINASTYQYVYENIHGQFESAGFLGGVSTSVIGYPEAETKGFELEAIYMPQKSLLMHLVIKVLLRLIILMLLVLFTQLKKERDQLME